jgi:hypothetical protein
VDRNFTRSSLRAFIRAADERLEDYLKRLDEGDVEDGATSGGARTKNLGGYRLRGLQDQTSPSVKINTVNRSSFQEVRNGLIRGRCLPWFRGRHHPRFC